MGKKNKAFKARNRARLRDGSGGGDDEIEDGKVDGSFHSPDWHAARLASLTTSHTITWEEFRKKQKEEDIRKGDLEEDAERRMREYRAQLDAERESKLSQGTNHSSCNSTHAKQKRSKKHSTKNRKHSRNSSSSSSSSSSSDEEERESRRSKSKSKRSKKKKKLKSRPKDSGADREDDGPVPLSRFFGRAS